MARLFFIRHGQASFMKSNYDQLSTLGFRQGRLLGEFWKHKGLDADMIISGDLQRQIQTAEAFAEGFQWNGTVLKDPGFNEHHGPRIVRPFYPDVFVLDQEIEEDQFDSLRRKFYGTYFKLAIPWVRGELDPDKIGHIEPWHAFRSRFKNSLSKMLGNVPKGANILVFTSGGPVGASIGEALDLDDEKTIQLGWHVKNTSITEFLYGNGRMSLVSFNEIPHLSENGLITLV